MPRECKQVLPWSAYDPVVLGSLHRNGTELLHTYLTLCKDQDWPTECAHLLSLKQRVARGKLLKPLHGKGTWESWPVPLTFRCQLWQMPTSEMMQRAYIIRSRVKATEGMQTTALPSPRILIQVTTEAGNGNECSICSHKGLLARSWSCAVRKMFSIANFTHA